ncbi:MAG: endonuclease III [Lachnospiraceae bacterium]|nr:endonuclease III [Lachnospiraceae bacterium]
MRKKQLAEEVILRLKREYPDSVCTLDTSQAWQLLVSVRLAAQCTDKRVNETVPELFRKYPGPEALAAADISDIERIVRPCGLYKTKAKDIKACMSMLCTKFGGKVPDTMEELLSLPGVGRKSANLILGDIFGKESYVCDTHCIRLSGRIGLSDGSKDPLSVEMQLRKIVPPEESGGLCHRLVDHGRAVCRAQGPQCEKCVLSDICKKKIR